MKTKAQKLSIIEGGKKSLKDVKNLVFIDFNKVKNEDLKVLRVSLGKVDSKFQIMKKRLLKVALKEEGINFDPKQFDGQVGTIFANGDISSVAAPVYKLSKEKEGIKILGGYDVIKGEPYTKETLLMIGNLPPREVLLGQVLGALTGPIRAFMHVLQERAKKVAEVK